MDCSMAVIEETDELYRGKENWKTQTMYKDGYQWIKELSMKDKLKQIGESIGECLADWGQKIHIYINMLTPLQYSCLENPMDGGAWQAAVHGVAESWT